MEEVEDCGLVAPKSVASENSQFDGGKKFEKNDDEIRSVRLKLILNRIE
jgi:hypothetical protein